MKTTKLILLALAGIAVLVAVKSAYIVRVDQYAIVTQFGKPVRTVEEAGLFFRIPFVQNVSYLDRRVLEWDDSPQEMISLDKKRIFINSFARWRIDDPLKYFTVVKTEDVAQLNLDKILGRSVRDVLSSHVLDEVVRDTNRELTYTTMVSFKEKKTIDIPADSGRSNLIESIIGKARDELRDSFGIEIIDLQIKQLNYTESAQRETIKEMVSERMVVVERYEAEGKEESEKIRGQVKEILQNLQADANKARLELEGEGEAQAIAIKSAAFAKSPELYTFLETMRLYEESFDENTTLVLGTDSPILELMRGPDDLMQPLLGSSPGARRK